VEGRTVDIVVPFHGSEEALDGLIASLAGLAAGEVESLTVVDNRRESEPRTVAGIHVHAAPELQSSYFARNRGAEVGSAEWILFLDADVVASSDLPRRYFRPPPGGGTGVLAGAVIDQPAPLGSGRRLAVAYAEARSHMSQRNTLREGRWSYAQTANCAVRRSAFEAVGGFVETIRSGGDADLCFRLREAGWGIEPRPDAAVMHRSRPTLRELLAQRARHGAGAAWLNRRHPHSFPRRRWTGLAVWSARSELGAVRCLIRGDRERALLGAIEPLDVWALELGRLASNEARVEAGRMPIRSKLIAR